MIKKLFSAINLSVFLAMVVFVGAAIETNAASLDKTSLYIYARRRTGSYEDQEKRGSALWGWTPQLRFRVNGPISEGGQLAVEFTKPDGKAWLKFNCPTESADANGWWQVTDCGENLEEDWLARETGLYGLKIGLKDELAGKSETLFTGKVKVDKFFAGGNQTSEKGFFGYYVDYDWWLPFGQVFAQEQEEGYENEYAPLAVALWFRGEVQGETSAHLFYKGKEISNTKDTAKGTWLGEALIASFDNSKFVWRKQKFIFSNAFVYNNETEDNHPSAFRLDKNPGEYEVKVLRKGALVRALKFSVGANGRLADNGIAAKNALGSRRMLVPVTVTGDEDGAKPDAEAWKTGAFFGNALAGFNL